MNILGSVGQVYMFVLLMLLFVGSGLAVWTLINYLSSRKQATPGKTEANKLGGKTTEANKNGDKKTGGLVMNSNGWLKMGIFSFLGILVSIAVLGFLTTGNTSVANSLHQQHQAQSAAQGTTTYGYQQGMGQYNYGSGSMNAHGNMNVNTGMLPGQMSGNMNMFGGYSQQNDAMMLNQQLMQMQMQLNLLQQQMNMMNGGMTGNNYMQGGMGNMQQGGNTGGMSGMSQGGGMSNMQQQGGSMGMMNGMM